MFRRRMWLKPVDRSTSDTHVVVRTVEQSLRDSDAIDVESLCIIAGEKVYNSTLLVFFF